MSGPHVSAVFADTYFTPDRRMEFLVALSVANLTNLKTGECFPSVESIAKGARSSIRAAQEALRLLQGAGKLSVVEHGHPSGTNLYRLHVAIAEHPPHGMHHPPQTSGATLHPELEGTVPSLCPDGSNPKPTLQQFLSFFVPLFAEDNTLPVEPYLRRRFSDYDTTGWKKGQRPIVKWQGLAGTLQEDYRNDCMRQKLGGDPNAPRKNGHNGFHKPQPKPITAVRETTEERLMREARERGDL